MTRSWTIGSHPECDLVVAAPKVSGRHCRLSEDGDGFVLEDLGSTNGTFVDGRRVEGRVRVARGAAVTLGVATPMPWPEASPRAAPAHSATAPAPTPVLPFRGEAAAIGRDPGNDLALDLPMISGRHARLSRSGGRAWIEDLGSANGTFVNGRRVEGKVPVEAGDLIGLGSHAVVLDLGPRGAEAGSPGGPTADPIPTAAGVGQGPPGNPPAEGWGPAWRAALLLAQAPVLAALVALVSGAGGPAGGAASRAVASSLYGLGLAALWFGLSDAALGGILDPKRLRDGLTPRGLGPLGSRFAVAGLLGAGQCLLAWALVSYSAGLQGPGLATLGLLGLTWAVGLALGLLALAATPRPGAAWGALGLALVAAGALGGRPWGLPRMPAPVRAVAGASPARWAFEGLLVLESGRAPALAAGALGEGPEAGDLAEGDFPAETDRMGVRAASMALGSMLVGLLASSMFLARVRASPGGP